MSKRLSLVVVDGKKIVETAVLCWTEKCCRKIVPKRQPDRAKGKEAAWIIAPDKRRILGKHASKMLETESSGNEESLYGFFALVGIGSRWADDTDVRWCLHFGERKLAPGMVL